MKPDPEFLDRAFRACLEAAETTFCETTNLQPAVFYAGAIFALAERMYLVDAAVTARMLRELAGAIELAGSNHPVRQRAMASMFKHLFEALSRDDKLTEA